MGIPSRGLSIAERLERLSIPEPNSGCQLWLGNLRNSQPAIGIDGVKRQASRVAYELVNGPLPQGMEACHRCDVPLCINEAHMFPGTHRENMEDMKRKKRGRPGTRKLTDEQVLAIRADRRIRRLIAADFGISRPTVTAVKKRYSYPHVGEG